MDVSEAIALIHQAIEAGKQRGDVYAEMADEAVKALTLHQEYSAPDVEPECEHCGARWPCDEARALVRIASKLEGKS